MRCRDENDGGIGCHFRGADQGSFHGVGPLQERLVLMSRWDAEELVRERRMTDFWVQQRGGGR
jgi:hypothetical protein